MSETFHKYLEMAEVATTTIKTKRGVGIKYHNTVVVEILPDGGYVLDSGGWRTSTTKKRMNKYIDREFSVVQKHNEWFVKTPKGEFPFEDGMEIKANGQVVNASEEENDNPEPEE